jgi:hypothetical protein
LPPPSPEDVLIDDIFELGSMDRYQGIMTSPESEVRQKLEAISFPAARTHIMKGWMEDTLARDDALRKVAFAYVDFDFYADPDGAGISRARDAHRRADRGR